MSESKLKQKATSQARVRNSVFYGIATGITVVISGIFLLFLQRFTESIGITVLIVSLIVCVLAVLYFVSRWYLTEILAAPLRSSADNLLETLEGVASGSGELEPKEVRGLLVETYRALREIGPVVWLIVLAGSLMGAVVVVVGLVNAAVIYQQTEVLERQTTRIDEQTKVMAVEFMNQSAIGLANIDQRLADLRRADRNFLRAQTTEDDVREILAFIPGASLGENGIELCAANQSGCEVTLAEAADAIAELGFDAPEFAALSRLARILVTSADKTRIRFPYRLEPENQETLRRMEIFVEGSLPIFIQDQLTRVLETATFTCSGSTESEYLRLRETMVELMSVFSDGAAPLLDGSLDEVFDSNEPPPEELRASQILSEFFFAGIRDSLTDWWLPPDFKTTDIKIADIAVFLDFYFEESQSQLLLIRQRCEDEMGVTRKTKDFINVERQRLLSQSANVEN